MRDSNPLTPLRPLIDACVHCGFCLPTCPSYVVLGHEMDSPRGRVYLMKAEVEDRVHLSSTAVVQHFDTCLGCMACETACPSGVRYAPLIETTRAAIERQHTRSLGDRLFRSVLFLLLPYPSRLRVIAWPLRFLKNGLRLRPYRAEDVKIRGEVSASARAGGGAPAPVLNGLRLRPYRGPQRGTRAGVAYRAEDVKIRGEVSASARAGLVSRLRNLFALAPDVRRSRAAGPLPERVAAKGAARRTVGLITGCVQQVFFAHVNQATARTLAMEGCDVVAPARQGCCGALALHAGRDDEAREFARALIETFEGTGVDEIVVNAAGCGSALKEYGSLLKDDPRWAERARRFAGTVRDLSETLAGLDTKAERHPVPLRVAYHDACHLAHAQRIRREPRAILEGIPGVTIVPIGEGELCCGSAGIFNLVQPAMAAELGERKVARIVEAGADLVVTSNPGCIVQIAAAARRRGTAVPVLHFVELLDASLRGVSADAIVNSAL